MRFFKLLHERNHIVVNIFGLKIKYRKPSVYERMYCSNPEIKHKRAIIFAIYDKNGKIPRNLIAYLKELRKYADYIILCSDCKIKFEEAEKVANIVDYVYFTRHREYDFGSYKRGWNILKAQPFFNKLEYVTFCNDSVKFAGHSFEEYFNNQVNYYAYGMTINNYAFQLYAENFPICYQPHMQSFFFTLSKNIYNTDWFNNFMSNIKRLKRKEDICIKYEVNLSSLILSNHFKINSYYPVNKYTEPSGYYLNMLSPYKGIRLLYKKNKSYKYGRINPGTITRVGQYPLFKKYLDKIFSLREEGMHEIVEIFGIKFKFKTKRLMHKYYIPFKIKSKKLIINENFYSKNLYNRILQQSKNKEDFPLTYILQGDIPEFSTDNINSVTVLIPVYNGVEHLRNLLPNLIKNTPNCVQIMIIDDCSPDTEIQNYLNNYVNIENIKIIRNECNLGFVKTINKGMSLINTKYAVWLNSDTILPKFWLERLLYPFDGYNKIATATQFTNSGVTFSSPLFDKDNEMVNSLDEVDKCFQRIPNFDVSLNETYSGTGFCIAISMECWKDVGQLDEENSGKGYDEENDWCFRALQKGYEHYMVPNLFVQHCHGGSFLSEEKKMLIENHLNILKRKYPYEIKKIASLFWQNDSWAVYRNIASILSCSHNPLLLIDIKLDSSSNSGAFVYRQYIINELKSQGYDVIIAQFEQFENNKWSIVPESCSSDIEIKLKSFSEIKILFELLKIKKVIINNLAYNKNVEEIINILCELKKAYSFNLSYKFHDYLCVCPSFFLINANGENCLYNDENVCKNCINNNAFRVIDRNDIVSWRNLWHKFFNITDEFDFFSKYSYDLIKKIFPVVDKNYNIKEHVVEFSPEDSKYTLPATNSVITFAFVGNYCHVKGSHYFEALANFCKTVNINARFIVIGLKGDYSENDNITYIQSYTRKNLGKILSENNVHVVIYPSINNETFSYVAQELMELKVPLVVFENGAPQERIRKYNYEFGEVAEEVSAEGLFEASKRLLYKVYSIDIQKQMACGKRQ